MASDLISNPITRFKYDWLVRLTELLPPETLSALDKFASISPLFTSLYDKYGAKRATIYANGNFIKRFESISPLNSGKQTIVTGSLLIPGLKKGTIDALTARRISFYYLGQLHISHSRLTLTDLKYFIRGVPQSVEIYNSVLTEPLTMSELWLYIKNLTTIQLHIENLIYDEAFIDALVKHPSLRRMRTLCLHNMPFDQKYITSIVESFLTTKTLPVTLWFHLKDHHVVRDETKKLEDKLVTKVKEIGGYKYFDIAIVPNDSDNLDDTDNHSDNDSSTKYSFLNPPKKEFVILDHQDFDNFGIFTEEHEWEYFFKNDSYEV